MPLVPLIVLVILGGLLLGGLLTRFFGGATGGTHEPSAAPSFTPLPGAGATSEPTQSATPSPAPSRTRKPAEKPSHKPSEKPSEKPSQKPSEKPSPAASASASPGAAASAAPVAARAATPAPHAAATRTPPPVIIITPSPAPTVAPTVAPTPAPAATATPVQIIGEASARHAAAIVRAYIGALANGDISTATGYLASGIPSESFINPNVNVTINDLRTAANGDGSYTVTAQIATAKGSYLETFTVRRTTYGLQITGHNAVRM